MPQLDNQSQTVGQFSEREQTILRLMATGLSNQEIADRLFLALTTIKWYINQINEKLDTHTRTQTLARARQLNLISDEYTTSQVSSVNPEPPDNPYKGLHAFQENDAADFFGRDELVERLLDRLSEVGPMTRFLALVGPSGCGKSSVVQAGLVPALRQGKLSAFKNGYIAQITPSSHPLEELEIELQRLVSNAPSSLLPQLREDERGLLRAVRRVLPNKESRLLLVIDQFEELFTLVENPAERQQFLDSLLAAVTGDHSPLFVVVTLRADFYDRPLLYTGFGELMRQRTEVVLPLTVIELEQAISRPAVRAGVALEAGLVVAMVAAANQQPGELPLLQYALTELFDYVQGRAMTLEAYRAVGGMLGALTRRADSLCDALDSQGQETIRQLFLRLVTLGEGIEDTRRRVLLTELLSMNLDAKQVDDLINTFAAYRLLTLDYDPISRTSTVELAHEALIREWKRLRGWLDESRADIRLQRILAEATVQWLKANQDSSFLLSGSRLAQFENWAHDTAVALTHDERGYLEASLTEREKLAEQEQVRREREIRLERRSRNFLRGLVAILLLATLGAFVLTGEALYNANEARTNSMLATSRELAIASVNTLSADPQLSLLLALQAVKTTYNQNGTWTREAEEALHRAVSTTQARLVLHGHTGVVYDVAYSPDGTRLATSSVDGTIKIWDVKTGQEVMTIHEADTARDNTSEAIPDTEANHEVYAVAFSPDGSDLATGSHDGTAAVWNATTGKLLLTLRPTNTALDVASVIFSPDGSQLALFATNLASTAGLIWEVKAWNLSTQEVTFALSSSSSSVLGNSGQLGVAWGGVAFSPDSALLAFTTSESVVEVWSIAKYQKLLTLIGHTNVIQGVSFSPDEKYMATVSQDGTAKIWDIATPLSLGAVNTIAALTLPGIYGVAFSPDGKRLATASSDGTSKIWDVNSGTLLFGFTGHRGSVLSVAFSPNGLVLATAGTDETVRLWDIAPGGELFTLSSVKGFQLGVAYSPDGSRFAAISGDEVRVYNAMTGEELLAFIPVSTPGWVAYSPDGTRLVTSGDVARVWDATTGGLLLTLTGHTGGPHEIAYSPDGTRIATAGQDKIVRLWDTKTGKVLAELKGHTAGLHCLGFSPDGKFLATGGEDRQVIVWDLATNSAVFSLPVQGTTVKSVLFSPDGQHIVTSSLSDTAEVWDVATRKLIMSLGGHPSAIDDAVFSPDGKYIATTGGAITKLWDARTGQALLTLYGHTADILRAEFSPNGSYLATTAFDNTLRVYVLSMGELLPLAQSRVTRLWTIDECKTYLHQDLCPAGI